MQPPKCTGVILLLVLICALAAKLTSASNINNADDGKSQKQPDPFAEPSKSGSISAYSFAALSPAPSWADFLKVFNLFRPSSHNSIELAPDAADVAQDFGGLGITSQKLLQQDDNNGNNNPFPSIQQQQDQNHQVLLEPQQVESIAMFPKMSLLVKQDQQIKNIAQKPSPVILVPGFGGSRLEARLDKAKAAHYFCYLKSDWFDVWINVKLLLPYMIDCFVDDVRLEFDYTTNNTKSPSGVEVRVKNESNLYNVEYLHQIPISGFAYMGPIVTTLLELDVGYARESNIIGAPYDFRKAPNELLGYFEKMRENAERLYNEHGSQPVTFICHSMGCNNMLYFLQRQSQDWKDTHVKRLISIAAPWAGCLGALKATSSGDNLGLPLLLSESKLVKIQRTLPSTIYLFPNKKVFADVPLITAYASRFYAANTYVSSPLATSPSVEQSATRSSISQEDFNATQEGQDHVTKERPKPKRYTARNFDEFFEDINHRDGYYMWLNTNELLNNLEAPNVEVHCIVGINHKTLGRIEYMGSFPNSDSVEFYDDGDGTVTLESAAYCKRWASEQKQPVMYKEFSTNHIESLKSPQVMNYIEEVMRNSH